MWDSAPSCPPALVSPRFTRGDNQARRCWPETCPCHTGSLSEAVSLPCWAECPSERPSPPSNLTAWKMPQPCGTLTSWQLDCIISPPARMEVGMIDLDPGKCSGFNQLHEAIPYFENHLPGGEATNEKKVLFSKPVSLIYIDIFIPYYS